MMKNCLILLISGMMLMSCYYSKNTVTKNVTSTMDGELYLLICETNFTTGSFFSKEKLEVESILKTYISGDEVEQKITKKDFARKIDGAITEAFQIDSVNFTVFPAQDRLDVYYFLSFSHGPETVKFMIEKSNEEWKLQ